MHPSSESVGGKRRGRPVGSVHFRALLASCESSDDESLNRPHDIADARQVRLARLASIRDQALDGQVGPEDRCQTWLWDPSCNKGSRKPLSSLKMPRMQPRRLSSQCFDVCFESDEMCATSVQRLRRCSVIVGKSLAIFNKGHLFLCSSTGTSWAPCLRISGQLPRTSHCCCAWEGSTTRLRRRLQYLSRWMVRLRKNRTRLQRSFRLASRFPSC